MQPYDSRGVPHSFPTREWRALLGNIWFNLPVEDQEPVYKPTFRSLFSYFARREADGGLREPERQSSAQQLWDQQVAVGFLLDLDWRLGAEWQLVRDREKTLRELREAAREGVFGSIISTSAQLRTRLIVAEQAAKRVRETLENFEVLPEYRELEREASTLTQELAQLSNENTLDEELIETIQQAIQEEQQPERSQLDRLYEEAGVVFTDAIKRRFDDVQRFHESVVANRRAYLQSELATAEAHLTQRRMNMQRLDLRRAEILRLLQSTKALDQFVLLQQELSRLDAETESLRQRFQAAEQLEGVRSELELERGRLLQRLRRDLVEQDSRVAAAITIFQDVSTSLYQDAGSLTLVPTENGLKIEIQIQGDRSRGIQNMQVFCFDMMLMRLSTARGHGPGFLIHDSHLFDGVDERQIGKALYVGATTAEASGWQYIVTMNEDDLPRTLPQGFDLSSYILPVVLTDEQDEGGLFGFRF